MKIIEYFNSEQKEYWLSQIKQSDWNAGKFLYELLNSNRLKSFYGEGTEVFLLVEGEKLLSFCTFAPKDDIPNTELSPWIGFVYTFPESRGNHYVGKLLEHIKKLARTRGIKQIYISTNEIGLYEKYSCTFYKMLKDQNGDDSRIYCLKTE